MAKVSKPILLEETYREQSVIQNGYLKRIADTLHRPVHAGKYCVALRCCRD